MKRWKTTIITAVILILAIGIFYKKVYLPKTTFSTIQAVRGDINVTISGIGNVGAKDIYVITAQTGGKILDIATDEGKWVQKGDLLLSMDGVDLPQQMDIAKANLQKANFEIKAAKEELKNQKAQKTLLEVTYNRYKRLKAQGFAAQAEYDKAKANLQSMDAGISATLAHIDSAKAASLGASKSIDAIASKIERLKVYAPVDGYVISKNAQVAQSVLPSTPILKIVDPKTLWVVAKIDERISAEINSGQNATIKLRSNPKESYEAIVKRVEPVSDAVTLEHEIDVAFKSVPKDFYINEQAQVQINIKRYTNVFKVPLKVVVQQNGKVGFWIVKESHAHFEEIQKIAQSDREIALSNADTNMQIIVPDATKKPLKEGMKIHL